MDSMPTRVHDTDVCIIGGGPAGMVLGLLLARTGVSVEVVERRESPLDATGADLLGPATLSVLGSLLDADTLRVLPQRRIRMLDLVVDGVRLHLDGSPSDDRVRMASVARRDLLAALARAGAAVPTFSLRPGTVATGLRRAGGAVTGATARDARGPLEIRARLTVGADGRGSVVRSAAGLVARPIAGPVDVVWASVPAAGAAFDLAFVGAHQIVVGSPDDGGARLGLLLEQGAAARLREAGPETAAAALSAAARSSAGALAGLRSWEQLTVETVALSRLDTWHLPGLLVVGDAAHPMSPLLAVGADLAVHDAVAAANRLGGPLRDGHALAGPLAAVGRRRSAAAEAAQSLQLTLHAALAGMASRRSLHHPPTRFERVALRTALPALRSVIPKLLDRGIRPETVSDVLPHPTDGVVLR
jgi:2-polyprenyl-6-methoxyphenol hydroxylase-like FAD-dependent oxidoreductase